MAARQPFEITISVNPTISQSRGGENYLIDRMWA